MPEKDMQSDHDDPVNGASSMSPDSSGALQRAAPVRRRNADPAIRMGHFERSHGDGRLILSAALRQMLDLDPDRLPLDAAAWADLLQPDDPVALAQFLSGDAIALPEGHVTLQLRPVVRGESRNMRLMGNIEPASGDKTGISARSIGVVLDQTEERHLQDALVRAQRLETVGRLAGSVAHDFNNLLTVILADLERARLSDDPAEIQSLIGRALDATEMGAGIARRLLSLAGTREPRPLAVGLDRHIAGIWSIMGRVLGQNTAISFHPGCGDSAVSVDVGELDAALLNLIINAKQAMPDGGEITVDTNPIDLSRAEAASIRGGRPGQFLRLLVADSGHGMPPAIAAQALEPFFTTKSESGGSGLGLTSVAIAAARAGGFVEIDSQPGNGTRVSLYLPKADGHAISDDKEGADIQPGNGELILLVESDPDIRDAQSKRLEIMGFAVIDAPDAATALDLLVLGEPVDLLLADLSLSRGMSATALMDEVHRLYPSIALMLISADPDLGPPRLAPGGPEVELVAGAATLGTLSRALHRALVSRRTRGRDRT